MANSAGMSIQPTEVLEVSQHFDLLADRVQRIMKDEATNLTVTAPGRDEVSQKVAGTLNEVHALFDAAAEQGILEMHEIAAMLRAHSQNAAAMDTDLVI